ncbi:MAG TPA: hypothetical protein VE134_00730 [Methanomicrobiales archaeon]|nr:hypothetical protein [Methanomicrobiales archaeon]
MSGVHAGERDYPDVVYSILADSERRAIVRNLAANGASGTISDLIQWVPEQRDAVTNEDEQALHIRLHHLHLPKMAEAGIIEYDHDDGRVSLTTRGEDVEAVRKQTANIFEDE